MDGMEVTEYERRNAPRQLSRGMRAPLEITFDEAEAHGYAHGFEDGRAGGLVALIGGLVIGAATAGVAGLLIVHWSH